MICIQHSVICLTLFVAKARPLWCDVHAASRRGRRQGIVGGLSPSDISDVMQHFHWSFESKSDKFVVSNNIKTELYMKNVALIPMFLF